MGASCSTDQSVNVKANGKSVSSPKQAMNLKSVSRPMIVSPNNNTTAEGSLYDDHLMAIEQVPEVERFEGDAVDSEMDGFGASITAAPVEIQQSVQSVSKWFQTLAEPDAASDDEHNYVSPSSVVADDRKNDEELVEAERLAPTGHYDATNVNERRQLASRRAVDPLMLATPKLPPPAKKSFFSF